MHILLDCSWTNLAAPSESVEEEADQVMKMNAVCQASVKKRGAVLVAIFLVTDQTPE